MKETHLFKGSVKIFVENNEMKIIINESTADLAVIGGALLGGGGGSSIEDWNSCH